MDNSKKTAASAGPGSMLSQARSELGLPIEEVAHMLNLSSRHIAALESDDYESLSGPTYVRGYLRSYSQLLGLSADRIIESYNKMPDAAKTVDLNKLAPTEQITSNDQIVKLGTFLVIGLLVGLAVIWWQGQRQTDSERTSVTLDRTVDAVAPAASSLDPDSADQGSSMGEAGLPPPVSAESLRVETPSVAAKPPPAAPVEPRSAPSPAPTATPVPANVVPRTRTGEATPGATGSHPRLVLYALEESWADIRDAGQNKLLYETVAAGRVVMLEGAPPLTVFLGNADGVRLEFNGRPYDVSRHKRGQIARFTLNAPETDAN
jgi:cytoskeleton protein RodZ